MADINLAFDEGILFQSSEFELHRENEDLVIEDLILTNKNLVYVIQRRAGLFKTTTEVAKTPLDTIKIINNQVMAKKMDHNEYGLCMQVQFHHGVEYWSLPKKEILRWLEALNKALLGETVVEEPAETPKKTRGFGSFAGIGSALKNATNSAAQAVTASVNQINAKVSEKADTPPATEKPEHRTHFCSNCGAALGVGAKFCQECGTPVNRATTTPVASPSAEQIPPTIPPMEAQPNNIPEQGASRRQEYVGTIFKCSNCGGVIDETTVICPECGMRITGRSAVNSVQMFKDQLMAIEGSRKKKFTGMLNLSVDAADMQRLSLIRNFPIPNSIDDILEFMLLAIANIDVVLSRNSMMNKYNSAFKVSETSQTISKTISDAWVSKMQQAYQKAEIMFPNDSAFQGIQRLYFDKMKELKIDI